MHRTKIKKSRVGLENVDGIIAIIVAATHKLHPPTLRAPPAPPHPTTEPETETPPSPQIPFFPHVLFYSSTQ